jgi:hypothetical protein
LHAIGIHRGEQDLAGLPARRMHPYPRKQVSGFSP